MEAHATRRTLVKPSTPTPPHLQVFRLSSFDQLVPVYGAVMFHYHAGGGIPEKIHRLEESLSETLTHFYHLAGRYGEPGYAINCNDQGVEFVEAKVNGKLDQYLLDGGAKYSEGLISLPSSRTAAGNSLPLVAIQVNVFECGGLVVSAQANHILCDIFSMCTFMNAWATKCRQCTLQVVPPYLELARLFPPKDANNFLESSFVAEDASKSLILKRFLFRNEGLSRLRTFSSSVKSTNCKRHPTRAELLTALICKVAVSMDRVKYGRARPMVVSHVVSLRGRTDQLPVHKEVFGNFFIDVTRAPFMTSNDITDSETFHKIVQLVGDTLRNAVIELGEVKDGKELVQKAETCEKEFAEIVTKGETNVVMFTNWCRVPLYGVDYGWGRPTLVSVNKPTFGSIIYFLDAENGDGIEVWVTLEDDDMNFFEHHPDILKYACQQP